MTDGHPLVWLWLVALTVTIASGTADAFTLAALAASLALTGLLCRGPRAASFAAGAVAAVAAAVIWLGWWLLAPGATAQWWLRGTAAAAAVCLALGVAGQMVRARDWLSLAALAGPLAPAFGWLCCAGEGCIEAAALRRQRRSVGGLTGWLTIVAQLADGVPGVTPRRLLRPLPAHLWQAVAAAAITAAWLVQDQLGAALPAMSFALLPLSVAAPLLLPRRGAAHA